MLIDLVAPGLKPKNNNEAIFLSDLAPCISIPIPNSPRALKRKRDNYGIMTNEKDEDDILLSDLIPRKVVVTSERKTDNDNLRCSTYATGLETSMHGCTSCDGYME